MDPKRWDCAIEIQVGRTPQFRVIGDTLTAAAWLVANPRVTHWRVRGGRAHLAARRACLAVLDGDHPPEFARLAFIQAAVEAEIAVRVLT